jgi:predicted dehydrogenase
VRIAINVALAGLGFDAAFVDIYRNHPKVGNVGVYDQNPRLAEAVVKQYGIAKVCGSFDAVLADEIVDACI